MKPALALCLALLLPPTLAGQDVDPRVLRGEHAPPTALWLEQLDLAPTTPSPGGPLAGRTARGNPIVLGRVLHPRGIGIPAPGEWSLPLHGQAVRFLSFVGVPDEAACGEPRPPSLRYVVKADGRVVADSGLVRWGDAPKLLDADLAGKETLVLAVEVEEGARGDGTWAGALLLLAPESGALRAGARPPSFVKPRESVPGAIPLSQALEAVPWLNGPSLPPGTHALDALLAAPGTAPVAAAKAPFPMGGIGWTRGVPGVADREIEIDLGGQAHRLMTMVGLLDDATCAASDPGLAAARFRVFADGVQKADSGPIGYGSEPVVLLTDVRDARTLRLVVEGGRAPDREAAAWAGTLLSMAPGTTFVPVARLSDPRPPAPAAAPAAVTGELRQWHPVTLTLDGPLARERDTAPNPFLDYRLTVRFAHASGAPTYDVPGYFAADGRAGETSAEEGTKWRAHVSPDRPGRWTWRASMVRGPRVAVDPAAPGEPVAGVDGATGSFEVQPTDKAGRDFRAHGRLGYVGGHYLRFAGSGRYFLKAGADAPETLLAYADFDGTAATKKEGPLKTWAPHARDWRPGDPTWKGGKGKGLIGALGYLAGRGMNAVSFLTYNAGGDGDNVWPFVDRSAKLHYDCSKLDQWRVVFEHAQSLGLFLHFKTQETENDDQRLSHERTPGRVPEALDGGAVGVERRLYYRELVARFSHLLALNWNLGEENTQTPEEQRAMAAALRELDPYDHPVVIHTHPGDQDLVYTPLLGPTSGLSGASLQNHWDVAHQRVLEWRRESARAGRPWVVANDEQGDAALGVPPDEGYEGFAGKAREKGGREYDRHDVRRHTLWGTLLAGGAGVEYYFGYSLPQNDLLCEDWRSREGAWHDAAVALRFFEEERIPFWEMEPKDALVGNAAEDDSRYAFAKRGEVYLVYLPRGGTAELDLRDAPGRFAVAWLDPRNGGRLRKGSVRTVEGGQPVSLGSPPSDPGEDWLAVVRARPNVVLVVADDLGYGDVGAYGQKLVRTPRIDRLAAEGLRFTDFYAGSTVCAPSRAVLMTGRHMGHVSVRGNAGGDRIHIQALRPGERTIAHLFREAGYATALFGKWGLGETGSPGHPNRMGFDTFFGYLNQRHAHNYYPTFLYRDEERVALPNVAEKEDADGAGWARTRVEYSHDRIVDEALAWVDANHAEPFFLVLAVTLPHANNEARAATGDGQEVPDYGDYAREAWPNPDKGQAAMIARLDRDVGRLLDRLEARGIAKDTLVLFTSDNGPHQEGGNDPERFDANGPLRGLKRALYEGGIRVPMIARWPGRVAAGATTSHVAYFGDMFATFAELLGQGPPAGLDSVSLAPTLLGRPAEQGRHPYLYWEFYEQGGRQAVRFDRWKAIREPMKTGPVQLFDLEADLGETNDLAPARPDLAARAVRYMDEAHVPDPLWTVR